MIETLKAARFETNEAHDISFVTDTYQWAKRRNAIKTVKVRKVEKCFRHPFLNIAQLGRGDFGQAVTSLMH